MTFKSVQLLKKLKTAQMYADSEIMIDFDDMTAGTIHVEGDAYQEVSLRGFESSIISTLDHLVGKGYICYDRVTGWAQVTHAGWNATSMTVREAVQFTIRDVIVPIIVAVVAAVITTKVLN